VRISSSEVVGLEVLPPIVTQQREQQPELKVELVLTNQAQDLLRLEADIAVRMVRPRQLELVARSISRIELGLFAHQNYLGRLGTPRKLADFAIHSVIGDDQPSDLVRNAALVRLLPRSFSLQLETWVAMHEDLRNVPRCRVAFDALVEGLLQYAADPAKPRR